MWRMSLLTRAAATLAATAVVLAPSTVGAAHADDRPLPSADAFYQYGADGQPATPPATSQPGDVIDSRSVPLPTMVDLVNALNASSGKQFTTFSIQATQLLYRTQNELGQPSATVTTVLKPTDLDPAVPSKGVVAYLSYYDGLSDSCDPSYTLQDGSINGEKAVIGSLLEAGYTVTVPDFEGETLDWAAGHENGKSTLDAIRATETQLGLPASTKVGTIGYSGGSFAGEWAAELAPKYAPSVNLIGTAIGGIPANLRDLVKYVDGNADTDRDKWFGVIPAATVSLGRAVGKDFVSEYGSDYGKQLAGEVQDKCIADFAAAYPGKHLSDLVKPGVDFLNEPDIKPLVDGLTMGTGGTPKSPMLMFNGNNDGIGDGVMPLADVKALAARYCTAGLPVQFNEQTGPHGSVGNIFMIQAIGYLADRFAGKPAPSNCARAATPPTPPALTQKAIHAKLKGHSKRQKDVLVVTAKGATGAKVKLFRAGHKKAIGHGTIHKNGKVTIKVKDRNGSAKTRYHATVGATATTKAARTKVLRLR